MLRILLEWVIIQLELLFGMMCTGGDYDLVGLQNCYITIAYSPLLIRWDTIIFNNYQNDSGSAT